MKTEHFMVSTLDFFRVFIMKNFFPKFEWLNSGCSLSVSLAYLRVFTVIGCSIKSVYPCVIGSLTDRSYMNIFIQPVYKRCSSTAVVMWRNTILTDLRGWFCNHFVPLIPEALVVLLGKSATTFAQVASGAKKKETSPSTKRTATDSKSHTREKSLSKSR